MGTSIEFDCGNCGYRAEVSGGMDYGMVAVVRTMTCRTCRELVDVLIGRSGKVGPTGDPEYDRNLGICPRCRGTDVTAWKKSMPCPRCDARMSKGQSTMLWD